MFNKKINYKKHDKSLQQTEEGEHLPILTPEEMNLISMQMSWGCGMLSPLYFPYGFWYY